MKKIMAIFCCLLVAFPFSVFSETYDIFVEPFLVRMSIFFGDEVVDKMITVDSAKCFLSDEKNILVVGEGAIPKVRAVSISSDIERLKNTSDFSQFSLDIQHLYQCTLEDEYVVGMGVTDFFDGVIKPLGLLNVVLGSPEKAHAKVVKYADSIFTVEIDLEQNSCMVIFSKAE